MKRIIALILLLAALLSLAACVKMRVVHCDGCGAEVKVRDDSGITEDLIVLCSECQSKLD